MLMSYLQQTSANATSVGNGQSVQLTYGSEIHLSGQDASGGSSLACHSGMDHSHQQVTLSRDNSTIKIDEGRRNTHAPNNICNDTAMNGQIINQVPLEYFDRNVTANVSASSGGGEQSTINACAKTPNSYKYPSLKKYFEFGPWVGRNRRATCLACRVQSASSPPERLLKHLNRCHALSTADKAEVAELMNERTANKRRKPGLSRSSREDNQYCEEEIDANGSLANSIGDSSGTFSCASKKPRQENGDRADQIDEALTRWIILHRVPLKTVHSREFVELVHSLDPNYHIPSRDRITNVLIPSLLNIV